MNSFLTQTFKNAKSFVVFCSAIQPRCDKHLYLYQLIIGTHAENRKVTVKLLFYDCQWVRTHAQKLLSKMWNLLLSIGVNILLSLFVSNGISLCTIIIAN